MTLIDWTDPHTQRVADSANLILLGRLEANYRLDATSAQLAKWKQVRAEIAEEDMPHGVGMYDHLIPIVATMISDEAGGHE